MARRFVKNPNSNLSGFYPNGWSDASPNAGSNQVYWCNRAPTVNDFHNWFIGARWIDQSPAGNPEIHTLVKKENKAATWVRSPTSSGTIETLTGNAGGPVGVDANDNINIVSGIAGMTVSGNPATYTLTLDNVSGNPYIESLRGDGDVDVYAAAGNYISILGTAGQISSTEDVGNHRIVLSLDGAVAIQFTADDTNAAIPAAGNVNIYGGTVGRNINTTATGATVRVECNNAITLGDLSAIATDSNALTATTGDIEITSGNLKLPNTTAAGSDGVIKFGGNRFVHNYGISFGVLSNVFVGAFAGNFTHTSALDANVGIGSYCLNDLTTGHSNAFVGSQAAGKLTTGTYNVGIGQSAALNLSTGINNTCIGNVAGATITTGGHNTCIGADTVQVETGSYVTALGYSAGSLNSTTTQSSNVYLASLGVVGESNTLRIGNNGSGNNQQDKCFIAGIRGITTGVADAIAVLIDSSHQLGTVSSSRKYKINIDDMGDQSSLIMKLRPVTFNFKEHPDVPAWGLIAEEVAEVFPQLAVYNKETGEPETVKYHELPTLLLNELQRQHAELQETKLALKNCRDRLRILEEQVSLLLTKMPKE